MIPINAIWLFSLIAFGAISLAMFLMIFISSKARKTDFSFRRNFPYEVSELNPEIMPIFKPLLYVVTALAFSPIFFITPLITDFGDLGFLCIFITCAYGLLAICNCLLFFFDARFNKTHIILVTISMCLAILANLLTVLLSFLVMRDYQKIGTTHIISIICLALSALIAVAMLILAFNPKLKNWAKLEANKSSDGEKTYSRGKVFILAFSEWLTILLSILGEIVFFLSMIK